MAFVPMFDEQVDSATMAGCQNDGSLLGAKSYGFALSTTASSLSGVEPGIYQAFLAGMSAAATVLIQVDRVADTVLTTPSATGCGSRLATLKPHDS